MACRSFFFAISVVIMAVSSHAASGQPADANASARRFIAGYEANIRPLEIKAATLWWDANITGKEETFQAKEVAENQLDEALADPKAFAELKAIQKAKPSDPLLARQIDLLVLGYTPKQVDPALLKQMTAKSNVCEKTFSRFRANVAGKELTDNEVREILRTSHDPKQRQEAWSASKAVGRLVEADFKVLVGLRNKAARQLGYPDYHVMQLAISEQDQSEVVKLFDQLDSLTREPFRKAKAEIDAILAKNCGIAVGDLRPWHYHDPFCQESPAIFGDTKAIEAAYAKIDVVRANRDFYAGIGMPIDDVLARSDLFEKPGKNAHAFCSDIDRAGDVRIFCNIKPTHQWLATTLHELGHATYASTYIPATMPYLLRTDANMLCTEGVAMMFENQADNAHWLITLGANVQNPDEFNRTMAKIRRNKQLIFSRWCQVMLRFEKSLYANPDQDLNKLWWDLVEKYQEIKRPEGRNEPDFAAKLHVIMAPAYYQNYMLGELFSSQVRRTIAREVFPGVDPSAFNFAGTKGVGQFMIKKVYAPGRSLHWNELTRQATGEPLNPKSFAADLQAAP